MLESPVQTIIIAGGIVILALVILMYPNFFYTRVLRMFKKPVEPEVLMPTWTPKPWTAVRTKINPDIRNPE